MPEGPEVYLTALKMNKKFKNKKLLKIHSLGKNTKFDFWESLEIENVLSKGKFLYMTFKNSNVVIFSTFGTMGQWSSKINKYTTIHLEFENGNYYFNDQIHYGTFKISNVKELNKKLLSLGPDVIIDNLDNFIEIGRKKNKYTIDQVLTNQKIISGIGNYLVAEILYDAKILPNRLISTLTDLDLETIKKSIKKIVNYFIVTKEPIYKVYLQKYDPYNNLVVHEKRKNNRMMHYVPNVQL